MFHTFRLYVLLYVLLYFFSCHWVQNGRIYSVMQTKVMYTVKNSAVGWTIFWCNSRCNHKTVKPCSNIWRCRSTTATNFGTRFDHLTFAATAATKVGSTYGKNINSVKLSILSVSYVSFWDRLYFSDISLRTKCRNSFWNANRDTVESYWTSYKWFMTFWMHFVCKSVV